MSREERLAEFVGWALQHITGDEKGQAQIFLDRLFQAFGHPGVLDVGGQIEFRIRQAAEDGGGTAFADLVWKPVVLFEMKRRGVDLQRHYRQALDYWFRLVPNRPRYVVLCNFDQFRVYDFETQMDTPVDTLPITELPARWGPLAFLFPGDHKPTFNNDRVAVTREAAAALATCFRRLVRPDRAPSVPRPMAQRFILQMLVALFAEDIGLLEKYSVTNLLNECHSPTDTYDLIGGLFAAMNSREAAHGGRFKDIPYFNGGLFNEPARLELLDQELVLLRKAADFNWTKVQPEIFGTLFQHSMGAEERHAFGAHFTHPADIMKIVGPSIVQPWREQIDGAKTLKRLIELRDRLHHFRVLDPACGCGNFLYLAYRELKRLEAHLLERMQEFPSRAEPGQRMLSFLNAQNFYGLDIQPFAVEIAKVTMMIARKLVIDELHITEPALPLDNLDQNFIAADALITPDGQPAQWPKADVIIGTPPFLGAKRLKPDRGVEYVNAVRRAYPDVPGMADYCVYWFRKAHDNLPECTVADPVAGRAGLVGTQNIRNNQSRSGGLDHVVNTGTITEAVDNQPWSGEANVHVSIANWAKTHDAELLPVTRKLWFKVQPPIAAKKPRHRHNGPAASRSEQTGLRASGADQLVQYYDQLAGRCDEERFGNSYGHYLDAQERRLLGNWLTPFRGGAILDLACGTGRLLDFATHGLDASPAMVRLAQAKHPQKCIRCARASEVGKFQTVFDAIFCLHLLMHLPAAEIRALLTSCFDQLRPGGVLIFDVPSALRRKLTGFRPAG